MTQPTDPHAETGHLPERTQVLVSGGGPVGLATALELGRRGVDVLVIEPRAEVSHLRPRCKTVNVRTMEHLRRWGIADALRERAPLPTSWSQDIAFCTSLTGRELSRFHGVLGLVAEGDRFPELGQQVAQYEVEELLRDTVRSEPTCRLVTGARVVGLAQDDDVVRVEVADASGETRTVLADYVVGCDGARSTVREQMGSAYVGEQALRPNFGMVFTAPSLHDRVVHDPAVQYWIVNDAAPALMGPLDLHDTWWIILFGVDEETGRERGAELLAAAIGADVDAQIVSTDPWIARMQLVDSARRGRVLLAGDAAHLNPPFGGHGLNTGVGDAVDVGWKLAAVLQGWGGPALLDSYEAERRPVQDRVIAEATANMRVLSTDLTHPHLDHDSDEGDEARRRAADFIQQTKRAEFHALDLVLDISYASPVLVPSDGDYVVGHRLPHRWLAPDVSLYDRLGDGFSLLQLAGDAGVEDWVRAAAQLGVPLAVLDLRDRDLRSHYGADLVLVRPDQYVAWRGSASDVDPGDVLSTTTGRSSS